MTGNIKGRKRNHRKSKLKKCKGCKHKTKHDEM